jgi:hypothetical protein
MSDDDISISQEQAVMIEAGVQPALDALMATGEFPPTLYVHDGKQVTYFTVEVEELESLHATCKQAIADQVPEAVAYVLLYDSSVETEDGTVDVLIIETGDAEYEEAHEFARMYSREDGTIAAKITRLGTAPHLLK